MQRGRTRTKRQRNDGPKTENCYEYGVPMSGLQEESLECQEGPSALCHSPKSSYLDQQSSDASTSTQGPLMPMNAMRLQCPDLAFWSQYMRQVYIGNSHCPVNGWYQACRMCNSWTAEELDVGGKAVPLCRGCQLKCHNACARVSAGPSQPSDSVAATSSSLLALDRAWEDYLNKLRLENGMLGAR